MKDVAVVRDVLADAISTVNDIIKTYDDVKKVCDLKLRVVDPVFKKDLFIIKCREKEGVMVPIEFTYNPPEYLENNNLIKSFPTMDEIRTKIRKYIKKEIKRQFEGAEATIFDRVIESFLLNNNLSMYGGEFRMSLEGLSGFVLPLPETRSSISVNITKNMVSEDGFALFEACILLHIGSHGEFIGNTHLWLFALKHFMKEMVRQKVAKIAAKVRNIVSIHLEGVVDDPF